MASNAKNLAEYLNNETTSATADIADKSITYPKTSFWFLSRSIFKKHN